MSEFLSRVPPAVVIAGMHRSGTSYAASLLHAAGLFLGDRLLAANSTNPRGHFEDWDVIEFHQALLRELGVPDTGFVTNAPVVPPAAWRERARALVAERRAGGRPWGWKDPRTALLLDFWRETVPEARYLVVFRPPWDVVDSLYRRGDEAFAAEPVLALDLWLHTNRLLRDFARRHPGEVLVREVSQLAEHPREAIAALRERFGIPLADPENLFEPALLAQAGRERAAFLAAAAPESVALLADLRGLAGLEAGGLPEGASSAPALLTHGLAEWQRTRGLEQTLREAEATAARVAAEQAAKDAAAAHDRGTHLADDVRRGTELLAAEIRGHGVQLAAERRAHDEQLAALARTHAERCSAIEQAAAARITALEEAVTGLRSSSSWRITAPLRLAICVGRGGIGHARYLLRRCRSPAAAARALARGVAVVRADGITGLVAAIRAARARDEAVVASCTRPQVRLPGSAPRFLPSRPAASAPVISLLVPVFETPAAILEATIGSVLAQTSDRWQLVLVDDASRAPHVAAILATHAAGDPRIIVHRRETNGGIAAASNDALARASGEFVAFLDHDDLLAPEAVARVAAALEATAADALYTDQDTIDAHGHRVHTFHKPDWSPEYLRHVMYVGHLLVVRRSLADRLGGFDARFDGVQDFEFALRLGEATSRIAHVPEVLYHWRAVAGSVAASATAKRGIGPLQARAVQEHLDRLGLPATAAVHPRFAHRCMVTPRLTRHPRVSIVIPSRDRPDLIGECLRSIHEKTVWPDLEVVVVDTGSTDPRARAVYREHAVRVVDAPGPFNFSGANNRGAAAASGEILVFLNNDTAVVSPDWIEHVVFHLLPADVGAVGPLLVYPDGRVQHAGVVLGARGTADHVMRRFPADADGYSGSLSCPREVSAVTGACLGIRRESLARVGGWNELYATHYQDVDLCLKLRRAGLRCLVTPDVRLVHHESPSRGDRYDMLDRLLLLDTFGDVIAAGDAFYPAACSLDRLDYSPRDPRREAAHA